MGRGLTIRLALKHDILIGSRSVEKAGRIARSQENVAKGFYTGEMEGSISGVLNADAISGSEVVIVTLPSKHSIPVLRDLYARAWRRSPAWSGVYPTSAPSGWAPWRTRSG